MGTNSVTAPGDVQWWVTDGGSDNDVAYAAIQTTDGGFVMAGETWSYATRDLDFWLLKFNAEGTKEWSRSVEDSSGNSQAVIQTTDGGYAMVGKSWSIGTGVLLLAKFNAEMEYQWRKGYGGGSSSTRASSGIQTADGGFVLAGSTKFPVTDHDDFYMIKTDESGKVQWERTFGGAEDDMAFSIIETMDGGYALVGRTDSYGSGGTDAWLVKTDAEGKSQWMQTYGGSAADVARVVIQTTDGGYALTGETNSYGAEQADFWLVKTDASGTIEWQRTYGSAEDEAAYALTQTIDGGFAIAGIIWFVPPTNKKDALLVKTDPNGMVQWNRTYGGPEDDEAYSIIETADRGFALAGYTKSYGAGGADFWLVKIAPEYITTPLMPPLEGDSWHPKTPMPTPRSDLVAVAVKERIYVIGGYNGMQNLATVEEYDPVTDSWHSRAPMPTARGWLAAAAVNGKIYAIGGWNGNKYLPTVEEYDPTSDTWRPRANMPTHRYGLAVVALGGRIYAIGGQNEIGLGYQTTVEEYDPATDTWRSRADMATRRYGLAAGMVRSRIYALGGFNAIDGAMATVEEYNPILNKWYGLADMPTAQISLAAGTVGGRLYAIGGIETYPSPVQEYEPLTNTWESRTPMPTPRSGLVVAMVKGRLYAIGGNDGNKWLSTVEEYDPPFYDTDGDGFADDDELRYGRDPLVPEPATETDTDEDGLLDTDEVTKYMTNPWIPDADADTDGDRLSNVVEVDKYGTNLTVADTDRDGLEDGEEVLTYETDPLVVDTDGDTYSDGVEVDEGTNPLDPAEHPETTTSIVTGIATGETSAVFIPGFTLVELVFALACLIIITRRVTKR